MHKHTKKRTILICVLVSLSLFASAQEKPDALAEYRKGRRLDNAGRTADARTRYKRAVQICQNELKATPRNMDSYAVYTWALFRLKQYNETVRICNRALAITSDARIIQTRGEAYFYLDQYEKSLSSMEAYIAAAPTGERVSYAYFYLGEIYRLTNRYNKADIAYSHAVHLESGNPLWWYRLGLAREFAGNKETALSAYRRAVRLRPDYSKATERIELLKNP